MWVFETVEDSSLFRRSSISVAVFSSVIRTLSKPARTAPMFGKALPGPPFTASLSLAFNATLRAPHGGIFVIGLIGNWPLYLLAIAIGTVASAALVIGVKEFTGGSDKEEATTEAS